jgi:signal transduction histidine kinase
MLARLRSRRPPLLPEIVVSRQDLRTIIVAPTGKDGRLIANLLERQSMACHVANDVAAGCEAILDGAGAAIISEEAFVGNSIHPLLEVLRHQPPWSDFPVILLTISGRVTLESERLRELRRPLGNLFLLERPIRPETLLSTLEIALRGRQRQYQIRDQIQQYALAQAALLRSEKLAVTGRLAASIAHEINNPLEAVTNILYLMHGDLSTEKRKQYLVEAEQELARVAEITKQTLRFYREPSQPTETDVSMVLDSVLRLHGSRLKAAGVRVNREILSGTATVLSTPGELRQILANIIGNATDAMRHGGCLRIRIANRKQSQPGGASVRLTIADNGTGIPPDVLPTIFEPFVTTKGETGTGLGLWVTSEIIKKNGWNIRVRSSRNPSHRGTVFSIVIPKLAASSCP